jgi:hypothetical protein
MGLFDSMKKRAEFQQEKALISYQSKLNDAYHSTNDSDKKRAIAQKQRETSDRLRSMR